MTRQQRLGLVLSVICTLGAVVSAIVFHRPVNLGFLGFVAVIQYFLPLRKSKEDGTKE
jgi:heme/copper-type cytochrome/quinol oxidase subunit 4